MNKLWKISSNVDLIKLEGSLSGCLCHQPPSKKSDLYK